MSSEASSSITSMREARRSRARRAVATSGPPLSTFIASWQLALEAAAKSSRTVRSYTDSARAFCRFLLDQDMPASIEDVDAPHVRAFLLAEEQRTSAASAAVHFRNIRMFFGWLASEGENPNPMDRVEAPKVTKKAKAFFTDEELAQLLKTCSGATFVDRHDTAIERGGIWPGWKDVTASPEVSLEAGIAYARAVTKQDIRRMSRPGTSQARTPRWTMTLKGSVRTRLTARTSWGQWDTG